MAVGFCCICVRNVALPHSHLPLTIKENDKMNDNNDRCKICHGVINGPDNGDQCTCSDERVIPAANFLATVAQNVDNGKLDDAAFREFIRNTLPIVIIAS